MSRFIDTCTINRTNWLAWISPFLLALLLAAGAALIHVGSVASGGTDGQRVARVELPGLRTRTSSTYENPDGTRTTVVSLGSVHYRDESWLPIDTSVSPAIGRAGYAWQNGANGFHAFFRPLLTSEHLRLETQDRVVALTLEGANPLASAIPLRSRLTYAEAFPGVDLRYQMLPDAVKETFVLADAQAPSEYRFLLTRFRRQAAQGRGAGRRLLAVPRWVGYVALHSRRPLRVGLGAAAPARGAACLACRSRGRGRVSGRALARRRLAERSGEGISGLPRPDADRPARRL